MTGNIDYIIFHAFHQGEIFKRELPLEALGRAPDLTPTANEVV